MEAHVSSLAAAAPKSAPESSPHYIARRYAELTAALRKLHPQSLDAQMNAIQRAMRSEIEKLLQYVAAPPRPKLLRPWRRHHAL